MRAAVNHETGIAPHKQENDKEVAKAAAIPVPEESDKEMESSTDDTKRRKQSSAPVLDAGAWQSDKFARRCWQLLAQ